MIPTIYGTSSVPSAPPAPFSAPTMSDYDSSDSELHRAIALSLQEIQRAPVIDLLSDDENDRLDVPSGRRRAPVESDRVGLARTSNRRPSEGTLDTGPPGHTNAGTAAVDGATAQASASQPASTPGPLGTQPGLSGIAGVERKRMEEERLARVRKRKAASISPPPLSRKAAVRQQSPLSSSSAGVGTDWHSIGKGKMSQQSIPAPSDPVREKISTRNPRSEGQEALFPIPRSLVDSTPTTLHDVAMDPRARARAHAHAQEVSSHRTANDKSRLPEVLSYKQQLDLLAPGIHFPNGAVKKTWVYGCPRQDDIKIEEVLQKEDLELAVLSAYQWDDEWILRKINMRKTKLICVVQAESEEQKVQIRANVPSNMRFCFPSMEGQINCMHSKLQLLSHPTHLRVVVPSANLVPYDWGEEGGVMENIVFIIDLPRLPNMQRITVDETTAFGRELLRFLGAMGIDEAVTDSILNFDFSKTSHLAFIHSIGGSHFGTDWKFTGYCGLGSAIQELGLSTKHALEIDIVSASIGNLTGDFLKSIYLAAQGDNGTTELNWRTNKPPQNKSSSKQSETELLVSKGIEGDFRLYFPSRETVASSKGGLGAGGTICFQSRWFDSPTFPRSIMRDCKSKRPGLLMHNKMLFVRPRIPLRVNGSEGIRKCVAWAYLGSANLSESAWGRLVRDRTTKQPKLNIRNWECGVVVPVHTQELSDLETEGKGKDVDKRSSGCKAGPPGMDVFDGVIPVPMVVPGEEYGRKRPWFYSEQ